MPSVTGAISELHAKIDSDPVWQDGLADDFKKLAVAIRYCLKEEKLIHIHSDVAELYINHHPFDDENVAVSKKLRFISFDVEEGAKCLAVRRATASVFHMCRVLESVTDKLRIAVGLQKKHKETMGPLIKRIITTISGWSENTPKEQKKKRAFEGISAFLQSVVVAWRNPTMHVEKSYSFSHASDIYDSVKAFVQSFAKSVR